MTQDASLLEFDAKESQIAIVDLLGVIQYTNPVWSQCAAESGATEVVSPGENYLTFFKEQQVKYDTDHKYREMISLISGKIDKINYQILGKEDIQNSFFEITAKPIQAFNTNCIVIEYTKIKKVDS